jgi:signal transduction histidine kinase
MANPQEAASSQPGTQGPMLGLFERVPSMAGGAVVVLGAFVLAGWALDLRVVTTAARGFPMIPLAALCFVLGGGSLIMAVRPRRSAVTEAIQQVLAALMGTIAVITIYEYTRASGTGIDLLLFHDKLVNTPWQPPGRISINSAATILLFALALLSLPHDRRQGDIRAQMFALPAMLIPLVAILGYVFGVKGMYSISHSTGMAVPTAIGHLILGVGILFANRERGVPALLLDEGAAGVLTRRLLPAAVIAPVVLGLIRLGGETAGLYETEFGVSLFAVFSIVTFVGLVLWSARVLRETDKERVDLLAMEQHARLIAERARAEAEVARAEAERANTIKTDFLAVMSHELRTPLTAIMGYEELLSDGITGPVTDLQRQQLGRINASARHLLGLIDEILTFARVDIGRERVRWESISVNETVNDGASLIESMATAKKLKFIIEPLAEDQVIQTDATKFRQMLVNLLSNAVKFTERGEVRLTSSVRNGLLEIRIVDTGVGIDAANIETVFEPFWQVEQSATRKAGGTGLGLSVTRKLARLLGGDVTVASRVGAGTTFLLTLPLMAPAGETVRRRETPAGPRLSLQA